ncbi:Protein MEI2-like 2 [Nosema granulosis]|uniref:Protein MEI2-like 2 n=1 Tax=Nosema granulosis TaxID=83296 RepID=A0A9P6H2Y1_9MICR|nr:Protein MEI2-like 2 [Nosema granulosis]
MHKDFLKDVFEETIQETAFCVEKEFSMKENSNKGYSFPRYLKKYEGFLPEENTEEQSLRINGEDVRRVFKINSEYVHSYFMEYQKQHFSSIRLCNNKVIERICQYFEQGFRPTKDKADSSCTSSDKENNKNTNSVVNSEISTESSEDEEKKETVSKLCKSSNEAKDCHSRLLENDKSLYLKKTENFLNTHVDAKFRIQLEDIEKLKDRRTTCMIKNIPNKYTQKMLIDLLNEHHFGCYDFVYLRMDFKNKCNVGYAFVNMIDPLCIVSFHKKINNKGWKKFSSNKIAQLTYASIQSLESLKKKFRKSSVMQEQESYRPKLFYADGPLKGYECTEF